jgi:hypothetical protein
MVVCLWGFEEVYLRYLFRFYVLTVSSCVCVHDDWRNGFYVSICFIQVASICFSQKFAKGGDCWVFVLAALFYFFWIKKFRWVRLRSPPGSGHASGPKGHLLLKQISMSVMLDIMFQHVLGIFTRCWIWCSNILARFSVSCFMSCTTRALSY